MARLLTCGQEGSQCSSLTGSTKQQNRSMGSVRSQLPPSVLAEQQKNHLKIQGCFPTLALLPTGGKPRIFA